MAEYDTTVSTRFVYDGGMMSEEVSSSGAVLRRYVFGPGGDEPVVWYEGAGLAGKRWLDSDERGSITRITDGAGATLAIDSYDEYGVPATGNLGRFGYTGQAWLPEIGLYDYKARMYASTLGRFLQTDPIGYADGPNWYDYTHGNPVNGSDPGGTLSDPKFLLPVDPPPAIDPDIVVTGCGLECQIGQFQTELVRQDVRTIQDQSLQTGGDLAAERNAGSTQNGDDISVTASVNCGLHPNDPRCGALTMAGRQGERGYTGSPNDTDDPFKHIRPDPKNPGKVIFKDPQTGKKISKNPPPGYVFPSEFGILAIGGGALACILFPEVCLPAGAAALLAQ